MNYILLNAINTLLIVLISNKHVYVQVFGNDIYAISYDERCLTDSSIQ